MTQNSTQKDRLVFREQVARDLGVLLDPPLSFRAAKFAAQFSCRDEVVRWLNRPSTLNTWQLGRKTYNELCQAFGLATPTHGPRTLGARLRAAEARIAELEQELAHFMELHGNKAFKTSIPVGPGDHWPKGMICSGGAGGKSTYQNGFTGATTSLPPETRITVNGKTFTLGEIDKEMTQ